MGCAALGCCTAGQLLELQQSHRDAGGPCSSQLFARAQNHSAMEERWMTGDRLKCWQAGGKVAPLAFVIN